MITRCYGGLILRPALLKLCYMREHPLIIIKSSPKFFHGFGKILISGQSAGNLTKGSSETTCKASSPNFSADFLY